MIVVVVVVLVIVTICTIVCRRRRMHAAARFGPQQVNLQSLPPAGETVVKSDNVFRVCSIKCIISQHLNEQMTQKCTN